jgi:hypothetical protein
MSSKSTGYRESDRFRPDSVDARVRVRTFRSGRSLVTMGQLSGFLLLLLVAALSLGGCAVGALSLGGSDYSASAPALGPDRGAAAAEIHQAAETVRRAPWSAGVLSNWSVARVMTMLIGTADQPESPESNGEKALEANQAKPGTAPRFAGLAPQARAYLNAKFETHSLPALVAVAVAQDIEGKAEDAERLLAVMGRAPRVDRPRDRVRTASAMAGTGVADHPAAVVVAVEGAVQSLMRQRMGFGEIRAALDKANAGAEGLAAIDAAIARLDAAIAALSEKVNGPDDLA